MSKHSERCTVANHVHRQVVEVNLREIELLRDRARAGDLCCYHFVPVVVHEDKHRKDVRAR